VGLKEQMGPKNAAQILRTTGWLINTAWVPSYYGINGNEKANILAKAGAHTTAPICKDTFTLIAWLTRWAHEQFLQKWQIALDTSSISWKYPDEWKGWTSHYNKAINDALYPVVNLTLILIFLVTVRIFLEFCSSIS
jgi:hypothetical protein